MILPLSHFQIVGMRQASKKQVLQETSKFLASQCDLLQKCLQEERSARFKNVGRAIRMRLDSMTAYQAQRAAVIILQGQIRAIVPRRVGNALKGSWKQAWDAMCILQGVVRTRGMQGKASRSATYQRPPGLPDTSQIDAKSSATPKVLSIEAETTLENQHVEELRKKCTAIESERLEASLRQFFTSLCPELAAQRPEEMMRKTAAAGVTSQRTRINDRLRTMNTSAFACDLTSTEKELELQRKLIEVQQRMQELEHACQHGWAKDICSSTSPKKENLINVYEVKLNINLNALTVEQLRESRKSCVIDFARTLLHESREYLRGVLTMDTIQELERDLLEPWQKRTSDWYNKDVQNFKMAIDNIFTSWNSKLAERVVNLKQEAEQKLSQGQQDDPSGMAAETALKLLKRAIHIAERTVGTEIAGELQGLLCQLTETQQNRENRESGAVPSSNLSTLLFAQASMILTKQSASPSPGTARPESHTVKVTSQSRGRANTIKVDPIAPADVEENTEKTFAEALPLIFKALKIRHDHYNSPNINLIDCKNLLQEICSTYTEGLVQSSNTPEINKQTVRMVLGQLDLVSFFHVEILGLNGDDLASTAKTVCLIIPALCDYGIKTFEELVSFLSVDDVAKLQLPQQAADFVKDILHLTEQRRAELVNARVASFSSCQKVFEEQEHLDARQADTMLASLTSVPCHVDLMHRPVIPGTTFFRIMRVQQ